MRDARERTCTGCSVVVGGDDGGCCSNCASLSCRSRRFAWLSLAALDLFDFRGILRATVSLNGDDHN